MTTTIKTIEAAYGTYEARTIVTECGYECRLHEHLSDCDISPSPEAIGTGETEDEALKSALSELKEQWADI